MSEKNGRWDKLLERFPSRAVAYAFTLLFVLAVLYKIGRDDIAKDDYSLNLYTEFLGVIVSVIITVFIIDTINRRRDQHRREEDSKVRLVRQVRSPEPVFVRNALHEIQEQAMFRGEKSILQGEFLFGARWENVTLNYFNLKQSDMTDSTLKNALFFMAEMQRINLWISKMVDVGFLHSNLAESNLGNSTLVRVKMRTVNLQGANLELAKMEGIEIRNSNLTCTSLKGSDLKNAILEDNKYDENTILPDGSHWKEGTDLTRFTDPGHNCCFWRSPDPNSPAYRDPEEETD